MNTENETVLQIARLYGLAQHDDETDGEFAARVRRECALELSAPGAAPEVEL